MPQGFSQPDGSHRVVVLVDESTNPFEVGVATELFGLPRPELGLPGPLYELTLCTPAPDVLMNHGFFVMSGAPGLDAVEGADTLIVPGRPDNVVPRAPAVLDAIRHAHARGTRVVSFCTGSFALAEAGLLDGRRATTHWKWAEEFRSLHPKVLLEPDVLYVDEGDVLTAAGSAAALDLGLYLIRRDHGAEIANAVSRRLVFAAHRDGGQRQFVRRPVPDVPDESLAPLLAWARERLDEPLTVADLAIRAAVSPATLHRRFRTQLGTTPLAWLTGERVALACRLIERGEERVELIARSSGLGTSANLRVHLRRETGLTPSQYRQRFGPLAPVTPVAGERVPRTGRPRRSSPPHPEPATPGEDFTGAARPVPASGP